MAKNDNKYIRAKKTVFWAKTEWIPFTCFYEYCRALGCDAETQLDA